jgi:hypothetical protein
MTHHNITRKPVADLLNRFSELEPERCQPEAGGWWLLKAGYFISQPLLPNYTAILLGQILAAIAAHPTWDVTLQSGYSLRNEVVYFGITRHSNGIEFVSADDPEPAIALLDSYLQALEAVQILTPKEGTNA